MPPAQKAGSPPTSSSRIPPQWLAHLECLQKGLQDVQYQIGGSPEDERQGIPFTEAVMADELPVNCRTLTMMARWTRWSTLLVSRMQLFYTYTLTGSNAGSSSPPFLGLPNNGATSSLRVP
ncbi:UNVERIFIED_CONTAM: hypothetical protein Slati_2224400 [Sesamum latifolium]|uniref:Uncharacterized protein n=1 Tax=Sesamum latifolium TaxID=2727402 RepID=A0AAW2WT35_9LAMI